MVKMMFRMSAQFATNQSQALAIQPVQDAMTRPSAPMRPRFHGLTSFSIRSLSF